MVRLERYNVDDLLLIKPIPPIVYPGFRNAIETSRGMALSAWEGNECLGAAGITSWPLCNEAWAYVSPRMVHAYPLLLNRWIKLYLPLFVRAMKKQPLIARVHRSLPAHMLKWPEALGMTRFGEDEDGFIQYRRD